MSRDTAKVLTSDADGVLVMTINRPEVRNAVDLETAEQLAAAMDELDSREDLMVAVITGAGGTFCSGMDLKAFARGERPVIEGRGFAGIVEQPPRKPLIAAVEGWALGGGFELALAADIIVAARDAIVGLPEVKRGLTASAGGLLRLPKAAPYQLAMRMALTGDSLTAEAAFAFGLIGQLAESGAALAEAQVLARRIAANAPLAVRAAKWVLSQSVDYFALADFEMQRAALDPVRASADAAEGARAFAEKRRPVWTGR